MKIVPDDAVCEEWFDTDSYLPNNYWTCFICGLDEIDEADMDDHVVRVHNFEWIANDEDLGLSIWIQKQRVLR